MPEVMLKILRRWWRHLNQLDWMRPNNS